MRRILITFSGEPYESTTQLIVERAPQFGADHVLVYDDQWFMAHPFIDEAQNWWLKEHPQKRGLFWYCWKPLVIEDALDRCDPGDVVMWNDADSIPIAHFGHLFDQCRQDGGVMLFRASGHKNYHWCKRDAYAVMGMDTPSYRNPDLPAGCARFCLFEKGSWTAKQFIIEWCAYTWNQLANTFDPSVLLPEYPELKEHRCEQAILTLLAYRYGLQLYPEADYEMHLFDQQNQRPPETRQQTAPVKGSKWRNV